MVRGEAGRLYEDFRERGVAAIGWHQLAPVAKPGMTRKELTSIYRAAEPLAKPGTAISGASQVWRFINEIAAGDHVVGFYPVSTDGLIKAENSRSRRATLRRMRGLWNRSR